MDRYRYRYRYRYGYRYRYIYIHIFLFSMGKLSCVWGHCFAKFHPASVGWWSTPIQIKKICSYDSLLYINHTYNYINMHLCMYVCMHACMYVCISDITCDPLTFSCPLWHLVPWNLFLQLGTPSQGPLERPQSWLGMLLPCFSHHFQHFH